MKRRFSVVIPLLMLIALCGCSEKRSAAGVLDETETCLSGRILTQEQKPVAGARIQLHRISIGDTLPDLVAILAETDSLGQFHFDSIAIGSYFLEANQDSSLGSLKEITVTGGSVQNEVIIATAMSKIKFLEDSAFADTLYCPQLGRLFLRNKGLFTDSLIVPAGNYDFWRISSGIILPETTSHLASVAIPSASLVNITPSAILIAPLTATIINPLDTIPATTPTEPPLDSIPAIALPRTDTILIRPDSISSKDTYITFGYDLTSGTTILGTWGLNNAGQKPCNTCGGYDGNTLTRMLLQFELPDSLSSGTIESAMLELTPIIWITKDTTAPSVPIAIHQLYKSWKEGLGYMDCMYSSTVANSATIDGATAQDRYWAADGSAAWNKIGVALDGLDASVNPLATDTIPTNSTTARSIPISSLVRSWVQTPSSNNGILIRTTYEFTGVFLTYPLFASGEYATVESRPALRIVWTH